jgi:hypothetical protein
MEEVRLQMDGGVPEDQWKTIIEWCLVASQGDVNNRKSLLSIEVDSVAIEDDKFDTWMESKLNMALGKRPAGNWPPTNAIAQQRPLHDHLHMAHLLASTVGQGQGMMQFTQAAATQMTAGGAGTLGQGTPLEMSKGFDKDQLANLKDTCGVMSAKDIPNIWSVIQVTKGKAHDSYRIPPQEINGFVVQELIHQERQVNLPYGKVLRRPCCSAFQSRGAHVTIRIGG